MNAHKTSPDLTQLSNELRFYHTPWEGELLGRFRNRRSVIRLACPFIKLRNIRLILGSLPDTGAVPTRIKVLTRFNKRDCEARVHDLQALALLAQNPLPCRCTIDLRYVNTLHAKCFIFDSEEVLVTSSNLSYAAFYRNIEVAIASDNRDIVKAAIDYFDSEFEAALPLGRALIEQAEVSLMACPSSPLPESNAEPDPRGAGLTVADTEVAIDPVADATLAEIVDRDWRVIAGKTCRTLHQVNDSGPAPNAVAEPAFLDEVRERVAAVFGQPAPSVVEAVAVFVHAGAYEYLTTAVPDRSAAEHISIVGRMALPLLVALYLHRRNRDDVSRGAFTATRNYICSSNHLEKRMTAVGVGTVLMCGPSLEDSTDAAHRAEVGALKGVAHRLLGHLICTRPWDDIERKMYHLLELDEEFPFYSYRDFGLKAKLNSWAVRHGHTRPQYRVVSQRGPEEDKCFEVEVHVGGRVVGRGQGPRIRIAEWRAAEEAVKSIPPRSWSLRDRQADPVATSAVKVCEEAGPTVLRMLTGLTFDVERASCVLLPTGSPRCVYADRHELFAALGGDARQLATYMNYHDDGMMPNVAASLTSGTNTREAVVESALQTPLGGCLRSLAAITQFRAALAPASVMDTINALFAVVLMRAGFDECRKLARLLVNVGKGDKKVAEPARHRLQKAIQSALRQHADEALQIAYRELKGDAMRPLWQATMSLNGVALSAGSGPTRRAAAAAAAEDALGNPDLQSILEKAQARLSDDQSADG